MVHHSRAILGTACQAAPNFVAAGLIALAPPSQAPVSSPMPATVDPRHAPITDMVPVGPAAWSWAPPGQGGTNPPSASGSLIVTQAPGPVPLDTPASVILAPYTNRPNRPDIPTNAPDFDSSVEPVPEPESIPVLAVPLVALMLIYRRRNGRVPCRTLGRGACMVP
jgi:hypothetical protein